MPSDDRDPAAPPPIGRAGCPTTTQATEDAPCTEWVREFEKAARTVAGGGAVAGRIATAGLVAARAVSGRAAESFAGLHRCTMFDPSHSGRHHCRCGHQWWDAQPEDGQ